MGVGLEKFSQKLENPANIRINLISPETRVRALKRFAANRMGLSLSVHTHFFEIHAKRVRCI